MDVLKNKPVPSPRVLEGASQRKCAMAQAAAKLAERQNCASALSNLVCNEILVFVDVVKDLREDQLWQHV
jgi:hypothetical protein